MNIRTETLHIVRDGQVALAGVSAAFAHGEKVLLLGASSSGKTTFLKAMAGLIPPTEGTVFWDEADVRTLREAERRQRRKCFGMVFQTDALFDTLTVEGNVLVPLQRRGMPLDEAQARTIIALGAVELTEAAHKLPEELSGGMRKRAGIARAIVARPEVLLIDDPLAGLDPATGSRICKLLMAQSEGRTLVVCAPEPLPDLPLPRWICLERGKVAYDGAPDPAVLEAMLMEQHADDA